MSGRIRRWLAQLQPTGALLAVAGLALAGAIALHALVGRYEFATLNPRQVTKRDRLTGAIELCTARGVMSCTPATSGAAADPTPAGRPYSPDNPFAP